MSKYGEGFTSARGIPPTVKRHLESIRSKFYTPWNANVPIEFAPHPSTVRELCKRLRNEIGEKDAATDYLNLLLRISQMRTGAQVEAIKGVLKPKLDEHREALRQGLCPTYDDGDGTDDWSPGFSEKNTEKFESYMPCTPDNCGIVCVNAAVGLPHYKSS